MLLNNGGIGKWAAAAGSAPGRRRCLNHKQGRVETPARLGLRQGL
jgi:hypothetical protein